MGGTGFSWLGWACVTLALTCLAVPGTAGAQGQRRERAEIEVRGLGVPPVGSNDLTATERLAAARTAALVNALREAAEILRGVSVTLQSEKSATGGDIIGKTVRGQLGGVLTLSGDAILQDMQLVKSLDVLEWSAGSESAAPGRIEVEKFVLVSPPIRDLDVYRLMQKLHEAQVGVVKWMDHPDGSVEVVIRFPVSEGAGPKGSVETLPGPACPGGYSGVVVDARGLRLRLGFTPKIVSAGGLEVYGPAIAEREAAQQRGLVGYARDLEKARTEPRVGSAPLVIKATGVSGPSRTDAVVSDEDWLKLYALNRCSRLLDEARVLFLVD